MSLNRLARRIKQARENLIREVARTKAEAALKALIELVTRTPVDTSTALSNWQVALNTRVVSEINAHFLGQGGSTRSASIATAISNARSTLSQVKAEDTIYISNLVDYIEYLNDGSSTRPALNFVEAAVAKARDHIRNVRMTL